MQDETVFPALEAMIPQFQADIILFSQMKIWGSWHVGGKDLSVSGRRRNPDWPGAFWKAIMAGLIWKLWKWNIKEALVKQPVLVDVLLTDFRQWIACVYMAESVKVLPENIQQIIEVQEWDMRTREGVERLRELKAKSLPSIALDGELVYESIIPMQEELGTEIEKRYKEKNQHA